MTLRNMVSVVVSCVIASGFHSALAQQTAATAPPTTAELGSSENLDEIVVNGIKRGDLILLVVFGAGLTWGAAVIEW